MMFPNWQQLDVAVIGGGIGKSHFILLCLNSIIILSETDSDQGASPRQQHYAMQVIKSRSMSVPTMSEKLALRFVVRPTHHDGWRNGASTLALVNQL
jgi:hypothetical protein